MGVFVGLTEYIKTIPAEDVPTLFEPHWLVVTTVINSMAYVVAVGVIRNVYGYARNYFVESSVCGSETYDFDKLYGTWTYYGGWFITIAALVQTMVPEPYKAPALFIGNFLAVVVDLVSSEIKKLKSPTK